MSVPAWERDALDTLRGLGSRVRAIRCYEVIGLTSQRDVAEVAEAAVFARQAGARTYPVGQTVFDLHERGYCARFIRQCHEAAMGISPWSWEFSSPDALTMEENLRLARHEVHDPQRGDIIAFNRNSGPHGHIAIYLGDGLVAENTSFGSRGDPRAAGTKITRIGERGLGAWRVTGYYRPLPGALEPRLVNLDSASHAEVIACNLRIEEGVARVDLRALLDALGYSLSAEHLATQGKLYLRRN